MARLNTICHSIRRGNDQYKVVLSATNAYVQFCLIPALPTFWAAHPGIDIDIRLAARFDAPVEEGVVDLAIRFLHDHDTARPLGARGWRAVCHRNYFEKLGKPHRIEDVTTGVLLHEAIYNYWPQAFSEASLPIPADVTFRGLGDGSHVITAVLAGEAIALLPSELTSRLVREGTLVAMFSVQIEPPISLFCLTD